MIDSFDRIAGLIARCVLLLIAALLLWVAVPLPAKSAAQANLAQLLEQARAEMAARRLCAPDGTPLCFPPAAAVEGAQAHVIAAGRGRGGGKDIREGELSGYVDVYVEETDAPVSLILKGYHSINWRLHLSRGARLGAVHLMGYVENFVVGVPEGVPVTSRFRRPLERDDQESRVFAEHGPGGIYHLRPRGSEGARAYDENSFAYLSTGGRHAESKG